jgi:divalent metal cation (Fe/Co/Zn/Cd) transporter
VTAVDESARQALVRRGFALEWATLGWNVARIIVLAFAAVAARSVALARFGLDSLIEIGASTVVIWNFPAAEKPGSVTFRWLRGSPTAVSAAHTAVHPG